MDGWRGWQVCWGRGWRGQEYVCYPEKVPFGVCMLKELLLKVEMLWSFKMSGTSHSTRVSYHRGLEASATLLWEPQYLQVTYYLCVFRCVSPLCSDNSYSETSIHCSHMCHFYMIFVHLFWPQKFRPNEQSIIILDAAFLNVLFFLM